MNLPWITVKTNIGISLKFFPVKISHQYFQSMKILNC